MTGAIRLGLACVAALVLTACGESAQQASAGAKGSDPSWTGASSGHSAEGWKAGDQTSWEEQMRRRSEAQNEYVRIGGAS